MQFFKQAVSVLDNIKKPYAFLWANILLLVLALVDTFTGYELALSLFYLLPLSLIAWVFGRRLGVIYAVICALIWHVSDIFSGHVYSIPIYMYWNALIRFGFFIIVCMLLTELKIVLLHEKALSRTDNLTGAINLRHFIELLTVEIDRSKRTGRAFSIAYIDLDNFKYVNDHFGHAGGDKVLKLTVERAKQLLRKTDIVARLGGDEFAFLLPELDTAQVSGVIEKLRAGLLAAMQENEWPVTCSIGVLTCINAPNSADDVIKQADNLMYAVKNNGKNSVSYAEFS